MAGRGRDAIDEAGKRYGHLLVLRRVIRVNANRFTYWLCRCDCGAEVEVRGQGLRRGQNQSCGCLRRTASLERAAGMGRDPAGLFQTTLSDQGAGHPGMRAPASPAASKPVLRVPDSSKPVGGYSMFGPRPARPLTPKRGVVVELPSAAWPGASSLADA